MQHSLGGADRDHLQIVHRYRRGTVYRLYRRRDDGYVREDAGAGECAGLDCAGHRAYCRVTCYRFGCIGSWSVCQLTYPAQTVYLGMDHEDLEHYMSEIKIPTPENGPMLILQEGKSIPIKNGESTLDYRNPGEIIFNDDSIVHTLEPSIMNQLVMPHGSSSKIVLSDNTVVWLNAGSRLIYPSVFTNKTREVVLFGEAYFDVAKNNEKPFLVQTSALEIKVLGTEFNVSAYPDDNVIQTVLKEGSVSIRQIDDIKSENEILLKPNQLASFDKSTKLSKITNVNTNFYASWIDGLLSFENLDMNRVVKKLERYYDIKIQFEDPMLGSIKISGKLDLKQNKEEVFEYLAKVSTTAFEKNDEKNYKIK